MTNVMEQRRTSLDVVKSIVSRQLDAMACECYEFGIRSERTGRMELRTWSKSKAMGAIKWLRYKSQRDHHIYVRPKGSVGLILIDDVSLGTLPAIESDNLKPACVVETSPLNYQVWVRVSKSEIPPDLGTCLGEVLQKRYNGDPNSKDWRHFGRLAGFSNVKPEHVQEDGRYPFSKLTSCHGKMSPNADSLLAEANALLIKKQSEEEALRNSFKIIPRAAATTVPTSFAYTHTKSSVVASMDGNVDLSRVEFIVVKQLYREGHSPENIVLEMLSDDSIMDRKKGHVENYVRRTLNKAIGNKVY